MKEYIFLSLLLAMLVEVGSHEIVEKSEIQRLTKNYALNRVKREEVQGKSAAVVGDSNHGSDDVQNAKPNAEGVTVNCSLPIFSNSTLCKDDQSTYGDSLLTKMSENKGMLWRTLCVSLGVTGIVVIYFVVRAVRLRRRRSKSRKYGIITQHDQGDVEMEPLGDGNDEDDDYTVFEMNGKR